MGTATSAFRRELGALDSYAALVGILVGAGIFRVTGDAYLETGPSVVLGYVVLAPVVLATAIPYAAFLALPAATGESRGGGGDYSHIVAVFGAGRIAFLAGWLKLISYLGAAAYLALTVADYGIELCGTLGVPADPDLSPTIATACLVGFWWIQAAGVRWFARTQTIMFLALLVAIAVLVVPGVFAIEARHYQPFFAHGAGGFFASLPPLFFAYAGFEALAHHRAEVKDSARRLPRVFLGGTAAATIIFVAMAGVALGTIDGAAIRASNAPMATAAASYLPAGAAAIVALGGVLAAATSVNATLAVPPRLAMTLADEGLLPRSLGRVHGGSGTPRAALLVTLVTSSALLWSGQLGFVLHIAVLSLMMVYLLHGLALLAAPRRRPELWAAMAGTTRPGLARTAAIVSAATLTLLIATLVVTDVRTILGTDLATRFAAGRLTSIELWLAWAAIGLALHALASRGTRSAQ
ncbi:MAG: APC family permease [Planctomycetota bacterium]